jgi:hypothetical protein
MDLLDDPATGLLRGRYRLLERIGLGGSGAVYSAIDETLDRRAAIKVFRTADAADARGQEEKVALLASLNHHSLIPVLDAGVDRSAASEPRVYLVMELVEGADLRRRLDRGPIPEPDIARLAYDLAEGLQYLHSRGVVHGRITPANVLLVDYNGDESRTRARLTDFGIGELVDPAPVATNSSARARYQSPERAGGDPSAPAGDVYALGRVLQECFAGSAKTAGHARELPAPWAGLIAAMTARNPGDRPLVPDLVLAMRQLILGAPGRHRADAPPELGAPRATVRPDAPPAADEEGRMNAVRRYDLLDTPPDGAFDRITALAARIFNVPIALVTVVDHDRIWFKSRHGLDAAQIDRDPGLCASAILQDVPWVVNDARVDPRTLANPLVAGAMGLQFYAGAQLSTRDGYNLGTMCVIDSEPRGFTVGELATLHDLAAMVMSELELRLESRHTLLDRLTAHGG